jgi:hypothetical protein
MPAPPVQPCTGAICTIIGNAGLPGNRSPMTTTPYDEAVALNYISDRLSDPRIEQFFTLNRHKQAATRALLDLLGVPLPDWATRKLNGSAAANKAAMDRFRADNPQERLPRGYVPPKPR